MPNHPNMKFFLLALLACCFTIGCEVRAPVSGKVTFPDGAPLTVGEVYGYADGTHIRASVGEDGSFDLYEVKPGDRVPGGKTYTISIVNAETRKEVPLPRPGMIPAAPPEIISLIDPKFASGTTSGLQLEVPKSSKPVEFNIEVTKP